MNTSSLGNIILLQDQIQLIYTKTRLNKFNKMVSEMKD